MSTFNNKAHYHPVSQLNGNLTNGSYMLPGNGYYSVTGAPPRIKFDHVSTIADPKYIHNQSYRLDPIHSLTSLKSGSTLTKYYPHDVEVDNCRDRYVFVPRFETNTNEVQGTLHKNQEFVQFKAIADDHSEYHLNRVAQIPDVDTHVLPDKNFNDDTYRIYQPHMPYDMMALRETHKYNPSQNGSFSNSSPNFVSVNHSVCKP